MKKLLRFSAAATRSLEAINPKTELAAASKSPAVSELAAWTLIEDISPPVFFKVVRADGDRERKRLLLFSEFCEICANAMCRTVALDDAGVTQATLTACLEPRDIMKRRNVGTTRL